MAIPSRQIGWGTEENLLWQISKQLEYLTGVTYNSKKTLLNVASGDNAGAKIETYSGTWFGQEGTTPFLTVDLNQVSGGIIEYSAYSADSGSSATGTYWFSGSNVEGKFIENNSQDAYTSSNSNAGIDYTQDGTLVSFLLYFGGGNDVQLAFTVKLFTLPLYNA